MNIRETLSKPAYDISSLLEIVPMSRSWIYSEISTGKLRATKAGRRTIFLVNDVAQWLVDLREGPNE
jgi:predicted DNA-binding transcriptional regulator AlpA